MPGPPSGERSGEGLSTQMRPSIIVTSREEIARPRPVPPYLRVVELSAWKKAPKMRACLAGGMPMPVSETSNSSRTSPSRRSSRFTWRATSPRSVNLMALPTRLTTICRRRPASPMSESGTSGSTW